MLYIVCGIGWLIVDDVEVSLENDIDAGETDDVDK